MMMVVVVVVSSLLKVPLVRLAKHSSGSLDSPVVLTFIYMYDASQGSNLAISPYQDRQRVFI